MKEVKLNGLLIKVGKRKVKIYDHKGEVQEEQALVIIKYLYDEGFIDTFAVTCEIISST
jgi:hypothetical protein